MVKINLVTDLNKWELQRVERLNVERKYKDFTGIIYSFETHIPYTKYEYIEKAMLEAQRNRQKGIKTIAIFSDAMNLDLFSHYYKRNATKSSALREIEDFCELLKIANKVFSETIFLLSNHDLRIWKVIAASNLERTQSEEVAALLPKYQTLFENKGIKNVVCVNHYLVQIGDAVFSHFENNSNVPGAVNRWVVQYLYPRIQKKWSVAFQSHTHGQSWIPFDRKLVVETGACCDSLDYWRSGKMQGKGRMTSQGYGKCVMNKGKAVIDECRAVFCGWEGWL